MLPDIKSKIIGRRYELHDQIGQGGMGAVYRALDRLTGQEVALKQVLTMPGASELGDTHDVVDFRIALAQEFKLLASLRHPNVIEVLDYGFDAGAAADLRQPYFTMELLTNTQTVLEAATDEPLPRRLNFIVQILQALVYLHRRDVLHRDLKPANVLVVDGQVKVLDFGLSIMQTRTTEEDAGGMAGTLGYMAPEILMGGAATEASDLYAVGMIAYELLSGRHPFDPDNSDPGTLVNHVLYTTPDVNEVDVPEPITEILASLLTKKPEERYQDARAVIQALDEATTETIVVETAATRDSFLQAARLVGRDSELMQLTNALRAALRGEGSAWLIGGESGVGKSRLVDELRTLGMVEGAMVVRGQAVSEGRSPYQLWRRVFRWMGLIGDLEPVDAGLVKLLVPDVVALPEFDLGAAMGLEPAKAQTRLLDALVKTVRGTGQPVMILLEDLHWANSESIALLASLARYVEELPLIILASFRDDERPGLPKVMPEIAFMKLNRLESNHIAELSAAMLGESGAQPQVVDLLQRETEGNVFFLVEVVRALAEEAGRLDQIGRMTLPQQVFAGGVQVIVQRRLDRLPGWTHPLLNIAAVVGRQIDMDLMQAIAPDADLGAWLIECANAAVLEVLDAQWRFAHDSLRDGVLDQLDATARRDLHRQVAEAIEAHYSQSERAAALAHHWRLAGDHDKEQYYVILAGEQDLRSGAFEGAVAMFERALALLSPDDVLDEADSQYRRVYLQHRSAEAYLGFGGYEQARERYREALMICEQIEDTTGIARSLYALGDVHFALSELKQARQYYQEAHNLFQTLEDQSGVAKALNSLGNVAYELGDQEIAKHFYQQSLTLSREIGDQWGMAGSLKGGDQQRVNSETRAARKAEQERLIQEIDTLREADDIAGVAAGLFELGMLIFQMGDYGGARVHFADALSFYGQLDDTTGVIMAFQWLGAVSRATGDYDEAAKLMRKALNAALRDDNNALAQEAMLGMARLNIDREREGEALEILAFLLSYTELTDVVEDDAEQLVFDLEENLSQEVIAHFWDVGKAHTFESLTEKLMQER